MTAKVVPIDSVVVPAGRRPVRDVERLAESVARLGLLNPITVTESLRLVAGRNRLEACRSLGWEEIPATVVSLSDLDAELAEIDENLCRNELTALERAEQLRRRKEIYEAAHPEVKDPKKGRPKKCETVSHFATDTAAKAGLSARTVQQDVQIAERIAEEAKEAVRGTPLEDNKTELLKLARVPQERQAEVARLVAGGEVNTVSQATVEVKRREKRAELEARAAAVEAAPDRPRRWEVRCGDCLAELAKVEAGSVHLVFADPPYNIGIDYGEGATADRLPDADYLAWCERWLAACVRVLADDGSLWVLIGDEYAAEYAIILKRLGLHRRAWVKWYETFGVCNSSASNFSRTSRHLFYCVKDARRYAWDADAVSRPSDRQAKYGDARANPGGKVWDDVWQIPRLTGTSAERVPGFPTQLPLDLLLPVVGCSSRPGDLVLDPFNGSGTTGVAALRLGRRYLGIERSEAFAGVAIQRLKGEQDGREAV